MHYITYSLHFYSNTFTMYYHNVIIIKRAVYATVYKSVMN